VVALLPADAVRKPGDHKGRPYSRQCLRTFDPFRLAGAGDQPLGPPNGSGLWPARWQAPAGPEGQATARNCTHSRALFPACHIEAGGFRLAFNAGERT